MKSNWLIFTDRVDKNYSYYQINFVKPLLLYCNQFLDEYFEINITQSGSFNVQENQCESFMNSKKVSNIAKNIITTNS